MKLQNNNNGSHARIEISQSVVWIFKEIAHRLLLLRAFNFIAKLEIEPFTFLRYHLQLAASLVKSRVTFSVRMIYIEWYWHTYILYNFTWCCLIYHPSFLPYSWYASDTLQMDGWNLLFNIHWTINNASGHRSLFFRNIHKT